MGSSDVATMRPCGTVLIPVGDTAVDASVDMDARSRAFNRRIQTCELLVTYAVQIAGKPPKQ